MRSSTFLVGLIWLGACGGDDGGGGEPSVLPADYAASYQEVRNCRFSLEHAQVRIRVLASPDALTSYNGRAAPFPAGSIVVKEQYRDDDMACEGPIDRFTVMQKVATGSDPDNLDWVWQEVDTKLDVIENPLLKGCPQCHSDCGKPPEGFDGTCTVP